MNLLKRLFALAASVSIVITAVPSAVASADIIVPIDTASVNVGVANKRYCPDWVPNNYLEALEFSNTHGESYAKGEYICIVQQRPLHNDDAYYDIVCSGKCVENKELRYEFSKNMEFSPEDAPDKGDTEAYENYMNRLRAAGISEDTEELDNYFRVEVYTTLFQDLDVTLKSGYYVDGEPCITSSRTFTFGYTSSTLIKEQFDEFRFLPDCYEEYNDFIKEHGNICTYNGLIIFCGDVLASKADDFTTEQHGDGMAEELMSYTIPYRSPKMNEETDILRTVKAYKPVSVGEIGIDFLYTSPDEPEEEKKSSAFFTIEIDERNYNKLYVVENKTDLPEWVPTDLASALDFDNKYGVSHIEDGYICCVRRMENNGKGYTTRRYMKEIKNDNEYDAYESYECQVYSKVFGFPDIIASGNEGYDEYVASLKKLGLKERDIDYAKKDVCYSVDVFKPKPSSSVSIYWNKSRGNYMLDQSESCVLNFSVDKDGVIKETDLFGWIPDCLSELREYIKNNGNVSINGEYVVFCSIGRSFRIDPQQDGISEISKLFDYNLESAGIIDVAGGQYGEVVIYKPKRSGTVTVDFNYSGGTDTYEPKGDTTYSFSIDDDLNVSLINNDDVPALVLGDCNYDGVLGVSDVVSLQKWLLGSGKMKKPENADMDQNGVIDVFDLLSMKKQLVNVTDNCCGIISDPKPMLAVVYENHAWGAQQDITVYDENGTGYNMYLGNNERDENTYNELVDLHNEDGKWYKALTDIMKNEKAVKSRMSDDIVGITREMTAELREHKSDKIGTTIGKMWDAGQKTIYLIGNDTDGKPILLEIFSYGDCLEWIDCKEIQEYLKKICYSLPVLDIRLIHELEGKK
ncbi:MAG: dockerin type I repeat-containing protein [Ruminococcus sp.]|uniref:dockerin type I repeat-containing protein n=1 Tax=Ruminococcus sp. TaxID=41978 RepID=UPI0025EDF067|nr:dockerin type I repeat-containing protein [Ruminococcus sp.]MCR4794658.1 dockerin type I repeat-containing protein [Ruminococcus sp.]